ncbi:MAG TPA: dihydrofolate reductase family protein, partial [Prolixibacteraceae bacterium]
ILADLMNQADKIVISRTLSKVEWNNTWLVKDNIVEDIKKMKQMPGKDITILGSGSIISQFAELGLVDEYKFMIDPVILGKGTPIFKDIKQAFNLKLKSTRTFTSGVVQLCYEP